VLEQHLDRLPAAEPGPRARLLWTVAIVSFTAALLFWLPHNLGGGVVAMWLFALSAAAVAIVLPLPYALVSPLFMGVAGWLVDMLPFVILVGSVVVVARWVLTLFLERRLPRGARAVWLPIFLVAWTVLGLLAITSADIKHFVLLFGLQVLSSGYVLAVIDSVGHVKERVRLLVALLAYVVLLSVAVLLQWFGVPIQPLQNNEVSQRVEAAYGLDAFPNEIGMIKYTLSTKGGAKEFKQRFDAFSKAHPEIPPYRVISPRGHAWDSFIVIRFNGSARPEQDQLDRVGIRLAYDNVGLADSVEVPRMRSFARNALTYGGVCVALLPFGFFFAWTGDRRRRLLGLLAVAGCLFGAAFSLSRGAWVAIALGIVYLVIDGVLSRKQKIQIVLAFVGMALIITAVFTIKYGIDPLHARAGGEGSISTRRSLYKQTAGALGGVHLIIGYGTEQPRTASGVSHIRGRYIPKAGTHSTYLNYMFRTGIPGMLALIALYLLAALHARAASRTRAGNFRFLGSLTAMAVVSFAAQGAILSLFVEPIYTLVISLVVGLAVAWTIDLHASVWPWRTQRAEP
jgi:O-Antigen ligase